MIPDPPVNVVNSAHTPATSTAMPPGMKPNAARNTRTSRCAACDSASTNPHAVSSGIAGSVGEPIRR